MPAAFFAILTILAHVGFTIVLKQTVQAWPVGLAGMFSRVITIALLGAWVLSQGAGWRRLGPGRMLGPLLLMGALSIFINLMWFGSLQFTTATNVSMLMCMDLVFVVLIGAALRLERLTLKEAALLPLMLTGTVLLIGAAEKGVGVHLTGDLMAVAAAAGYAVNAFVIRRILRHMDEESVSLYNHGLSTLGFVGLAVVAGEFSKAGPAMTALAPWAWILALGTAAAVSLPLYYAALHRMEVWRLRAWLLATPVLVAVVEWLMGVRLALSQWLGAALVLGGLALLIRMELRACRAPCPESADLGQEPEVPDLDARQRSRERLDLSASPDIASPATKAAEP